MTDLIVSLIAAYLLAGLVWYEVCRFHQHQMFLQAPRPVALLFVFVVLWPLIIRAMNERG